MSSPNIDDYPYKVMHEVGNDACHGVAFYLEVMKEVAIGFAAAVAVASILGLVMLVW